MPFNQARGRLQLSAADEAGASLALPAPQDPDRAIDDLEHDLATLKPLLDSRDPAAVRGRAHYLLGLNEARRGLKLRPESERKYHASGVVTR